MPAEKLKSFLDENAVKYVTIRHSPAYTASEIAQSAHIPGRELAKTVMVKVGNDLAMVVLPASQRVDTARVSQAAGGENVVLAKEEEFRARFPGCEVGAMPPFGNLYGMKVFLSPRLAKDEEIAFNAGSHTELIRLRYDDYERLEKSAIVMLPDT